MRKFGNLKDNLFSALQLNLCFFLLSVLLLNCKGDIEKPNSKCKIIKYNNSHLVYNTNNQLIKDTIYSNLNNSPFTLYFYDSEGKILNVKAYRSYQLPSPPYPANTTIDVFRNYQYFQDSIVVNGNLNIKQTAYLNANKQITKIKSLDNYSRYEYDVNGNIIKIYEKNTQINDGKEFLSIEFISYDDKKNPFFENTTLRLDYFFNNRVKDGFGKNNPLMYKKYYSDGSIWSNTQINYEYMSENFPIKVTKITDFPFPNTTEVTTLEYDCD